jgi:hypothetical protein
MSAIRSAVSGSFFNQNVISYRVFGNAHLWPEEPVTGVNHLSFLASGVAGIDGVIPGEIRHIEEWHENIAPLFRLQGLKPMGKNTVFLI